MNAFAIGPGDRSVSLQAIRLDHLQCLARGETPAGDDGPALAVAWPPRFVAERSLRQHADGVPWRWCSGFLVLRTGDRAVVGSCGFKHPPCAGVVELGYGIAPACRRQGFARQAVQALLQRAFDGDQVDAVLAQVNPDNLASTRVVQALGFQPLGRRVDEDGETLVQWRMQRAWGLTLGAAPRRAGSI
jgi:RimJ/RimL family protein N-acetyltransferase